LDENLNDKEILFLANKFFFVIMPTGYGV
jgi:hypothetical protein